MNVRKVKENSETLHRALMGICECLHLNREELTCILRVCPKSFFNPNKTEQYNEEETLKVMGLVNFYVELSVSIKYQKNQNEWFRTPNEKLNGESPLDYLKNHENGTERLVELLSEKIL